MRLRLILLASLFVSLPAAAEPIRVSGQVVGDDLKTGLAGARVELFPAWEDYDAAIRRLESGAALSPLAATSAQPDGSFEIAAPETGLFRLVVRAEGRLAMEHTLWPLMEETALPELFLHPPRPGQKWSRTSGWTTGWWPVEPGSDSVPARVQVAVRDANGRPVSGAVIRRGGRAVARTGADGRVEVAIRAEESLSVEAGNGWRARLERPASGRNAVVRPQPPRTVAGRVVDAVSRRPVAGALVWIGRPPVATAVRTGDDGAFRILLPVGEPPFLEAAAAGYIPLSLHRVEPGGKAPAVLSLEPSATLLGVVQDGTGRPVPGARIAARPGRDPVFPTDTLQIWSGADGRFRLTGLRPSAGYRLKVEHERFARTEATARTAPAGKPPESIRIVMGEGQTASGRVVDESGRALARATLKLLRSEEEKAAESDGEGKFQLRHLNPGRYDLVATHPDASSVRLLDLEIPAGPPGVDLGEVKMPAGGAIEGRVVDAKGAPVTGAMIGALLAYREGVMGSGSFEPHHRAVAVTAEDGTFRVPALRHGDQYDLRVHHPGYVEMIVPGVEAPSAEAVQIILQAGRSLAGRVVGPEGEPVADADLFVLVEPQADGGMPHGAKAITDDGGRFRADSLPSGALTLQVDAEGYAPYKLAGLPLPEDGLPDLKVVLERGAQLEVQVLSARGDPAQHVMVQSYLELADDAGSSIVGTSSCQTDARGLCRVTLATLGPYTLRANAQFAEATVHVEAVRGTTPVEIRLPPGEEISGRVMGQDGAPVGGAYVQLSSGGEQLLLSRADGAFEFFDVPDGQYSLTAHHPLFEGAIASLEILVEGQPVRDLELRLQDRIRAVLTGRVLGLEPAEMRNMFVRAAPTESGGGGQTGRMNARGEFRIQDLEAGEWTIRITTATGREAEGHIRIEPGVRTASLDLELAPRGPRISGRVLLDGLPLPNAVIQGQRGSRPTRAEMSLHDGSFAIDVQEPGTVVLLIHLISGRGQGIGAARSVQVEGDVEVTVEIRSGRLRGTVTGPAGEPLEGAAVRIEGWSPEIQKSFFILPLRSGPDGTFEAPRLAAGTVRISVQAPGFATAETLTEIPPGGEAAVEIRLPRTEP